MKTTWDWNFQKRKLVELVFQIPIKYVKNPNLKNNTPPPSRFTLCYKIREIFYTRGFFNIWRLSKNSRGVGWGQNILSSEFLQYMALSKNPVGEGRVGGKSFSNNVYLVQNETIIYNAKKIIIYFVWKTTLKAGAGLWSWFFDRLRTFHDISR